MNTKINNVRSLILPNKKVNYFVISIMILGIITGSIFFTILNQADKNLVLDQINNFFTSIKASSISSGLALKNSIFINIILISLIFILGMGLIGLIINAFIVYIKGFLLGFSISSIIGAFGIKGILAAFVYVFPHQIINIITVIVIGIYSIMFSMNLLKQIISKKNKTKSILKKYFIIFVICIFFSVISAFLEAYLLPIVLKLIVNLYI